MARSTGSRMRIAGIKLLLASIKEADIRADEVGMQIRTLHKMLQNAELAPEEKKLLAAQLKKLLGALATGGL
jgi:hypothetical protein